MQSRGAMVTAIRCYVNNICRGCTCWDLITNPLACKTHLLLLRLYSRNFYRYAYTRIITRHFLNFNNDIYLNVSGY
jgi:hypothetical protein